jgi:integrase/recombinase XerC
MMKLARLLGMVPWILDVQSPKMESYRDTRGPGEEAYAAMLKATDNWRGPKKIRDIAILRLLHDLALRRGEVIKLDLEDVDVKESTLAVLGKGRTTKEFITLPEPTLQALKTWIKVRPKGEGALFVGLHHRSTGKRLTDDGLYKMIRELGKKVGIKVRPHGIRHTGITVALDRTGGDVRKVQKFSRHKSIQTVLVYDDRRRDEGGDVAKLVAGEEEGNEKTKNKEE